MKKCLLIVLSAVFVFSLFSVSFAEEAKNSLVRFNGDITVGRGEVYDEVVSIFGNADIVGRVNGDVVSVFGSVHLWPSAVVSGDLVSIGGTITTDPGVTFNGSRTVVSLSGTGKMRYFAPAISAGIIAAIMLFGIITLVCFVILAWLVILFAGKQLKVIATNIEKHWMKDFFWGLLGLVLSVPIAILLIVTIIGIPLVIVEVILIAAACVLGYVAAAGIVGRKALKMMKRKKITPLKEIVWGILILFLVNMIPFIGGLIRFAVSMIGFGAVIVTRFGYVKK